jgi:hypothetical protein
MNEAVEISEINELYIINNINNTVLYILYY